MEKKNGRAMEIRAEVLRIFSKHTGEPMYSVDLARETGFTEMQIQNCMWHLLKDPTLQIETIVRRRAWRFMGFKESQDQEPEVKAPELRAFEKIGKTRDGKMVIQDDRGKLYLAEEL